MSFFGRAANLIRGGFRSIGRKDPDADAYERALEAELRKDAEAGRVPSGRAARPEPAAPKPEPTKGPPERDASGAVKRTL
jgi:hypothetical protein